MLTLGIRYLNGFVAASHGTHERVEWPPHPARVFMAMVAAHYQSGAEPAERETLLWLEKQPPPEIHAPEALPCAVVHQYVPVNDDSSQYSWDSQKKKAKFYQEIRDTDLRRNRQDRAFARASLAEDTAFLHWQEAEPPPAIREALVALCAKVTRIGHSSSLVQVWLADSPSGDLPRWLPDDERATQHLRVAVPGMLAALDEDFQLRSERARNTADESKSRSPVAGKRPLAEHGYALAEHSAPAPPRSGSVFSPHLAVFTLEREDGPYRSLDLACTLALTDQWRKAIASQANDLPPEAQSLLSGHAPDQSPLQTAHVAFLPLGFVGHPHATGHLPGVALALPANLPPDVRRDVLRVAARVCEQGLKLGRLGAWKVDPCIMASPLETLRASTWTAHPNGATQWSTVTPIAFDQHPKARDKAGYLNEVAAMIRDGCERIGLPRPREVIPTPVSAHLGAPPAPAFRRLRRKDGSERRHTHAILVFDPRVCGPVLIGAGRYRGYGLCRPVEVEA
jgi:CRISPR-associated protein Csb2